LEKLYNAIMRIPFVKKACSRPFLKKLTTYEAFTYIFFGALTTLINWAVFLGMMRLLNQTSLIPNTVAWVVAVIFAYAVNKKYVFKSHQDNFAGLLCEFGLFILARVLSYFFDLIFVYATVDILHLTDWLMKILSNVFVLIMNFFASKLVIFRKKSAL
jgi:putative flippase GtrA